MQVGSDIHIYIYIYTPHFYSCDASASLLIKNNPTASCILALGINKDFLKKDKPAKRALVLSKV